MLKTLKSCMIVARRWSGLKPGLVCDGGTALWFMAKERYEVGLRRSCCKASASITIGREEGMIHKHYSNCTEKPLVCFGLFYEREG